MGLVDTAKLEYTYQSFEDSFRDVVAQVCEVEVAPVDAEENPEKRRVAVIVGIAGAYKGRVLLETGFTTAKALAEAMAGEKVANPMDIFLYIGELSNMLCGNAITKINNQYPGEKLRLAPPALFSGMNLEIITPTIASKTLNFQCGSGPVRIEFGFEGG